MTFKNEAQLKKFLLDKCAKAVDDAKEKVNQEFVGNLNQFYSEFTPEEYIRTGALFDSLESDGAKQIGDTITAKVYFNTPHYRHGLVPLQSGDWGYSYWDDEYIFDVAMTSKFPHGGYERGTAIWNASMKSLGGSNGIKKILKQELKKQGL
jgi:hypothetical protein